MGSKLPRTDRELHRVFFWPFKEGYDGAPVAATDPFHVLRDLRGSISALDYDASAGREQGRQTFQDAPDLPRRDSIRRICKYQMEFTLLGYKPLERRHDIRPQYLALLREPRASEVFV